MLPQLIFKGLAHKLIDPGHLAEEHCSLNYTFYIQSKLNNELSSSSIAKHCVRTDRVRVTGDVWKGYVLMKLLTRDRNIIKTVF